MKGFMLRCTLPNTCDSGACFFFLSCCLYTVFASVVPLRDCLVYWRVVLSACDRIFAPVTSVSCFCWVHLSCILAGWKECKENAKELLGHSCFSEERQVQAQKDLDSIKDLAKKLREQLEKYTTWTGRTGRRRATKR